MIPRCYEMSHDEGEAFRARVGGYVATLADLISTETGYHRAAILPFVIEVCANSLCQTDRAAGCDLLRGTADALEFDPDTPEGRAAERKRGYALDRLLTKVQLGLAQTAESA